MFDGLRSVRARCAYWEKRIELEPKVMRRRELAKMAWAEIMRLVIHHGGEAHGLTALQEVMQQSFAVALRHSASLPTKPARRRARAAAGGRFKGTV
jgi:hypothetical protein